MLYWITEWIIVVFKAIESDIWISTSLVFSLSKSHIIIVLRTLYFFLLSYSSFNEVFCFIFFCLEIQKMPKNNIQCNKWIWNHVRKTLAQRTMQQTTNYEDIKMKFMTYRNFDKAHSRVFSRPCVAPVTTFSLSDFLSSVESIWSVFFLPWLRQKRLLSLDLCFFRVWMRVLCGRMWTKNALVSCTGSHRLQICRLTPVVLFLVAVSDTFFCFTIGFSPGDIGFGVLIYHFYVIFFALTRFPHINQHIPDYTFDYGRIYSLFRFLFCSCRSFFTFPMHLYYGQTFSLFFSSAALIREKIPSRCDNAIVIK